MSKFGGSADFGVLIVCDTPLNLQLAVRFGTINVMHYSNTTSSCVFNNFFMKVASKLGEQKK
jgi:hypothetical protein